MNPEQKQTEDRTAPVDEFSHDLSAAESRLPPKPWEWSDPARAVRIAEAMQNLPVDLYPS